MMLRRRLAPLVASAIVVVMLCVPSVAHAQETDPVLAYQQFATSFVNRASDALNVMRNALIASGMGANQVTVTVPDSTNLRVVLTATRSGRTCVVYFELTPVGVQDGEMTAIVTLYVEGNASEITHSYVAGAPQKAFAALNNLIAKLTEAEGTVGEVTVKSKAFLRL
jgi:hypothetical protein